MKAERIYDRLYNEKKGEVLETVCAYGKIYDLPTFASSTPVSAAFFSHVLKRDHFINLTLYDEQKRIFLLENEGATWSLPGSGIRPQESIHQTVQRVADQNLPGVKIGEIEPIAFVENAFENGKRHHQHHGVAFSARVRNGTALSLSLRTGKFLTVGEDELERIKLYANAEIVKRAALRLGERLTDVQEDEIETNENVAFRYAVHRNVVKKLILTDGLKRKQAFLDKLSSKIDATGPLLDASCGDAQTLGGLLARNEGIPFAVGNDISWCQVQSIRDRHPAILLTNHDALDLPFKDAAFATTLCCNTLHHMPSRDHMKRLLSELLRVSRKVLFVEIEKPEATGGFPYVLNKYWYSGYLKDVGRAYMSEPDFQGVMKAAFEDKATVTFDAFRNIQGRYLIAEIEKGRNPT